MGFLHYKKKVIPKCFQILVFGKEKAPSVERSNVTQLLSIELCRYVIYITTTENTEIEIPERRKHIELIYFLLYRRLLS